MLSLSNPDLTVTLIDPAASADQARMGTRYAWGGYIWQVTDAKAGPLLAGPEWPHPTPSAFNGQGLPESFRHAEFGTNRPLMLENGRGFILGIGEVAPGPDGKISVTQPCPWAITPSPGSLEFCTEQSGNGYAAQLIRNVSLEDRTVISTTRLTNTGKRLLPLHWFAHPFFALEDRLLTCGLPKDFGMNDNAGYFFDEQHRLTFKRRFVNIDDGHFEKLFIPAGQSLRAELSHVKLESITFTTDFTPDMLPVWGNDATWSIEPYITTDLEAGSARAWTLRYEFGPVKNG